MSMNFSPGTPCEPCQVLGHFCQAEDFNRDDDPACRPCLAGKPCPQRKAQTPEAEKRKDVVLCGFGCGKPRHPGVCRERRISLQKQRDAINGRHGVKPSTMLPASGPVAPIPRPGAPKEGDEIAQPIYRAGQVSQAQIREVFDEAASDAFTDLVKDLIGNLPEGKTSFLPPESQPIRDAMNRALDSAVIAADDGEVVDMAAVGLRYDSAPLDQRLDRAMALPAGKGLRFALTRNAAKLLYDRLRNRIQVRKLNAGVRLDRNSVYLFRKEETQ
jgi:hypothetical protein